MEVGRTLLFVPGDRPDRIRKAVVSGADDVAVDFEDAVDETAKDTARALTAEALIGLAAAGTGRPARRAPRIHIRVNALDTAEAEADLAVVESLLGKARLDGLVVPKVRSAGQLGALDERLASAEAAGEAGPDGRPPMLSLLPVVESAAGILASGEIAAAGPRVPTLLFGTLDLAAELGVRPSVEGRELLYARSQSVLAVRAAGLPGPLDGPYAALDDEDGLVRSSLAVRELGFTGRAVLHPRQIAPVRRAFAPTESELARAREVLAAYADANDRGIAAVRLGDGTFVDRPVVVRAEALLREAERDSERDASAQDAQRDPQQDVGRDAFPGGEQHGARNAPRNVPRNAEAAP
ncbi:CoA ester lyase [Streptomyces sp. HNM0575]|uniref:HpcH/HpaI aldolase/citrate lyase family protein n=1 Tax=Streptomyces sp. HNM0575 TaxID=2716338 RepID=UPI00145FD028|nr:CoA ester lyase [Streptomyces sp. HNM0575]NLU73634.1 CoA ester lyase [Streptomyces sp. HNM0575]